MEKHNTKSLEDFRTILKTTREAYKITQTDFAGSLGITPKHLNRIENCIQFPSYPLLFEMCDRLGLVFKLEFNLAPEYDHSWQDTMTVAAGIDDKVSSLTQQVEELTREKEKLKSQLRAIDRLRIEDAGSAISEANRLRDKIKEQDLIIYGLEEGSSQWQSLAADKERDIQSLKSELEELKKEREEIHNKIMVKWEKDFGSIHSEQTMDAYTVSGFVRAALNSPVKQGD